MSHKGHPDCEHNSKKACDLARKVTMGQCSAMKGDTEPIPCTHWAIEKVRDRGYCGTHITSVIRAEDERIRRERVRAELDGRIEAYITLRQEHPSIWRD